LTPAVIALVGVLFSSSITLIGLLFKRSVDQRTIALAERNDQSRLAEQRRLQMDAAMRTVQLLTLPDGAPAPLVQTSSAVLMLAELGEARLALSLVRELWPKGQISASAAVRVIDDALGLDPGTQRTAANTLLKNVGKLDIGDHQSEWPTRLETWDTSLDVESRYAVALALIKWLQLRGPSSPADWRVSLLKQVRAQETDQQFSFLALPT
jgi:hypothetical protein